MLTALQLVLALWLQVDCIEGAEVRVVHVRTDQADRWEAPPPSLSAIESLEEEVEGPEKHSKKHGKRATPHGAHGAVVGAGETAWQGWSQTFTVASRERWTVADPRGPPAA